MTRESKEFKNALGDVYYRCSVTDKYVYQNWYGNFLSLEDVIEGSTCGLDMCEKYGLKLMVNNNSLLKGSWDHANEWIANVWMPRAQQLQLRRLAHIVSPDIFTALSAEEFKETMEGKLENRFFDTFEAAEQWAIES